MIKMTINKEKKRKIIWYKPPYFANIKRNIGKIFLNFINSIRLSIETL